MVRVTCAIFRAVFDSRSSFFSPRPLGNAIGVFPSRAPVLSFAHYFQAPATQAIHFHVSGRHQA